MAVAIENMDDNFETSGESSDEDEDGYISSSEFSSSSSSSSYSGSSCVSSEEDNSELESDDSLSSDSCDSSSVSGSPREAAGMVHLYGLDEYEVPLFEGSEMTVLDSYLLLYQYALKHSLTKLAFQEMIDLVNVHLPHGARITTIYKLKKFFLEHFQVCKAIVKPYCRKCHHLLISGDTSVCPNGCDAEISGFVYVPIEEQVKRILEGQYIYTLTIFESCIL